MRMSSLKQVNLIFCTKTFSNVYYFFLLRFSVADFHCNHRLVDPTVLILYLLSFIQKCNIPPFLSCFCTLSLLNAVQQQQLLRPSLLRPEVENHNCFCSAECAVVCHLMNTNMLFSTISTIQYLFYNFYNIQILSLAISPYIQYIWRIQMQKPF